MKDLEPELSKRAEQKNRMEYKLPYLLMIDNRLRMYVINCRDWENTQKWKVWT